MGDTTNYRLGDTKDYFNIGDKVFFKKGPFGSSLKKDMFVPKSQSTYKVYEQKNAISKSKDLGDYYISEEDFLKLSGFEVFPGDIIVSCAGTIGEVFTLPDSIERGIINQALMIIRVDEEYSDKEFITQAFNVSIDKLSTKKSNGSAIKNIPPLVDLRGIQIRNYPLEIQRKIGQLLCSIDKQILNYTKQKELLEQKKKHYLNVIFNDKDGDNTFTCKLNEIIIGVTEKSTVQNEYVILSSTSKGLMTQSSYFNSEKKYQNNIGYKIIRKNQFTYRSMSDTGKFTFNKLSDFDNGLVSPAYPVFESKIDDNYLYYLLNYSVDFKKSLFRLNEGSTRYALPFSKLCEISIHLHDCNKQSSIGNFLLELDFEIKKINDLIQENHKKKIYYLDKIFM